MTATRIISNLHDSAWQGVFHITGGGASLLADVLRVPGASRTLLEARIPYSEASLDDLLGTHPEQACSDSTARAMAMAAFQRARLLGASQAFGFASTASLATDREKKGRFRAFAAIQTDSHTFSMSWDLSGSRSDQEQFLTGRLMELLARALDLPEATSVSGLMPTAAEPDWRALILGESTAYPTRPHDGRLLLPGAFNPLHLAHQSMLDLAEEITRLEGAFELSVANVDKPFLDYAEIRRRLDQFDQPAWLTRLPRFLDKARYFPGSHFAIGVDTFLRIAEPRYYESVRAMNDALDELADLDTRFVVFGRFLDGEFKVLSDLDGLLPAQLMDRSIEVRKDQFNEPTSSTQLRENR